MAAGSGQIDRLPAHGSTNLHGGMMLGFQEVGPQL